MATIPLEFVTLGTIVFTLFSGVVVTTAFIFRPTSRGRKH